MSGRRVAVVAHTGKTLGGGLDELRRLLTAEDLTVIRWYEVPKSRKAPKQVRRALNHRPDLLVIWGGDGMVQRCADALVGHRVPIAIIPAGTANLLARNLGIPIDLAGAVDVAAHGGSRTLDLGRLNGEHFAVMAGVGFDAEMIESADGRLKELLGRLAYVWTGAHQVTTDPVRTRIKVDGELWFDGPATCVLAGNVPKVFGSIAVFDRAEPDDGRIEVGVTTARDPVEWARALGTIATGSPDNSPFVDTTSGRRIKVKLGVPVRYELDGGSRTKVNRLKIRVVPAAVTVRVPDASR
jgi:diacylglycerol kinase (ATP)